MSKVLQPHVAKLRDYLFQTSERNEDLALSYFRKVYGDAFKRQSDAANADGYVPGHFVLELKGDTKDWYSALFQGLAYQNRGLAFSMVIVAAEHFLGLWQVGDLPSEILDSVAAEEGPPSAIGKKLARKYADKKAQLLKKSIWHRPEMFDSLFSENNDHFSKVISNFEKTLRENKKVRQPVTLKNFVQILDEMKCFFDPSQPIKAVRAFYSMIYGPWDETSIVLFNMRRGDCATIGGVEIAHLIPGRRSKFKEFVENHVVVLKTGENIDDFFARYDEALDAVDSEFRVKNGIFFTDLDLSKFAMWLVKQEIPNLGRNYLVIDPACGSGNLVTNWRSPLELRHKVVSEIEPELLYAVEQRMKGDQWHDGKFTVVPKVSENIGLNFLDKSAADYISILKKYLEEKGQKPDKPIAFLCNPPYRSDDDQTAESVTYEVDHAIVDMIGNDAASERYCCFLAQMKLICQAAEDIGMPEDSVLMLFTKAAWLTKRPVFQQVRRQILGSFEDIGGVLVNGKEFFDLKGKFPIAFTMWRFKGPNAKLDPDRSVPLIDLTHLTKREMKEFPWTDPVRLDETCKEVLRRKASIKVHLGTDQQCIREWVGQSRFDFQREKTKDETRDKDFLCGLPKGDRRHERKKTLGHSDGTLVGFMDDLTPCRIRKGAAGFPSFHLDSRFMRVRAYQCFSGPADNRGYYANSRDVAQRMFLWYALGRTFAQCGYPMWADALELWMPEIPAELSLKVKKLSYAIGFAENGCVETIFPAGNPIKSAIELHISNPMNPLNPESFWLKQMSEAFSRKGASVADKLVEAVEKVFVLWKKEFRGKTEIIAEYQRPYFIGQGKLTKGAGLVQIKDYAVETDHAELLNSFRAMQELLKQAKDSFYELLLSEEGLNYFGQTKRQAQSRKIVEFRPEYKFDYVIEKRLALAATLIDESKGDLNFGVTKFVKLFYLADTMNRMGLETNYYRQAAGPLDPRALYNDKVGLLPMGVRHGYFETRKDGALTKFVPKENLKSAASKAKELLGEDWPRTRALIKKFRDLDTDQSEIVATLYACWNDLLLDNKNVTDELIVRDFLKNWHPKKTQFSKMRLLKALSWMRDQEIVPRGTGKRTSVKWDEPDAPL
jgi:hypothetical protein